MEMYPTAQPPFIIPTTITQIQAAIANGESEILELKKSLTQLKAAFETFCAFLNTSGGLVIIGINQNGKLFGQDITDKTQQEIANELAKIEPLPASINIRYIDTNEQNHHQLVIISTQRGVAVPYTYDGRAYYRNQTSTMRLPQSRYSQLLLERGSQQPSWESITTNNTIKDLDHQEIKRTINIAVNVNRINAEALGEPIEDILSRLDLIKENKITHAAMILFGKSLNKEFAQCSIKMARFKGKTELDDFIDNQIIYGNAFQLMKAANDFLMRHLPVASFFDESKFERIDKPLLPVLAVREAISNAICHRDYSTHNASITLAIFDDRMEIWNNGTLPSFLTLDDLKKKHKSYPRNKNIARVFYLRRYVETWGTGTTKMIKLCKEHDIPVPVFDEYSGGFSVVFKFKGLIGSSTTQLEDMTYHKLTKRQKEIFALIKEHYAISSTDILNKLNNPPSDRMIRKDLDILRRENLIKLEGHGKSAKWAINLDKNQ